MLRHLPLHPAHKDAHARSHQTNENISIGLFDQGWKTSRRAGAGRKRLCTGSLRWKYICGCCIWELLSPAGKLEGLSFAGHVGDQPRANTNYKCIYLTFWFSNCFAANTESESLHNDKLSGCWHGKMMKNYVNGFACKKQHGVVCGLHLLTSSLSVEWKIHWFTACWCVQAFFCRILTDVWTLLWQHSDVRAKITANELCWWWGLPLSGCVLCCAGRTRLEHRRLTHGKPLTLLHTRQSKHHLKLWVWLSLNHLTCSVVRGVAQVGVTGGDQSMCIYICTGF